MVIGWRFLDRAGWTHGLTGILIKTLGGQGLGLELVCQASQNTYYYQVHNLYNGTKVISTVMWFAPTND